MISPFKSGVPVMGPQYKQLLLSSGTILYYVWILHVVLTDIIMSSPHW